MTKRRSALSTLLLSSTFSIAVGCGSDDSSPNQPGGGASSGSGGSSGSTSASGGSSSGSGGSSAGTGGSSGDGETPEACTEASACCSELASDLAQACEIAVDTNDATTCTAAILSFQTQGYCTGEEMEDPTGGLPPVTLDGGWDAASVLGGGARAFERFLVQACGDGDVVGVWRTEGDQPELGSAKFSGASATWTSLGAVDENNGLYVAYPKLAVNSDCDAIALWFDGIDVLNGDDEYALTASRLSGTTWGTPFVLEENFQTEMSRMTLFVDPGGNGELGYDTSAPDPSAIARRLIGDGSADPAVPLNTLEVSGAAFGMLPSGDGLLFLSEYDDQQVSPVDVFLRSWTRSPSGEWSDAIEHETTPDVRQHGMKIIPADDRFYVVWQTTSGEPLFAMQVPGEEMVMLEPPTDFELYDAHFAANGEVLFAYGFGEENAQAARYSAAGGWEDPVVLNAEKHTIQNDFTLVVDSRGRATAVYSMLDAGVFANRFTPEEGWAGPHAIDIHGSDASITADAAGRVFISYLAFESTGFLSGTNNLVLRRFVPDELL
jgi:hypothetical protein